MNISVGDAGLDLTDVNVESQRVSVILSKGVILSQEYFSPKPRFDISSAVSPPKPCSRQTVSIDMSSMCHLTIGYRDAMLLCHFLPTLLGIRDALALYKVLIVIGRGVHPYSHK